MWAIANEENGYILAYKKASRRGFQLVDGDSHLWLYTFRPNTREGVYEIWRAVPKPITRMEALKQLLSRKPGALRGWVLEENKKLPKSADSDKELSVRDLHDVINHRKNTISPKNLSSSDLRQIIKGKKIWKEFQPEPLPQDIIIKKETSQKPGSSQKNSRSCNTFLTYSWKTRGSKPPKNDSASRNIFQDSNDKELNEHVKL